MITGGYMLATNDPHMNQKTFGNLDWMCIIINRSDIEIVIQ